MSPGRKGGNGLAIVLLKSVVRELQALLRSIGPEIPLSAISVRIQSLLISPVHTAVHSLSILVGASSPRIVPETAEGGLLLVTHNLRDDLHAEVVSQVNTERKSSAAERPFKVEIY